VEDSTELTLVNLCFSPSKVQ